MIVRLAILLVAMVSTGLMSWLWPQIDQPPTTSEIAQHLFENGRSEDALLLFDEPVWRGVAEYRAGRYARAIVEFFPPTNVVELYNLGTTYAQLGEWNAAITALEAALRLDPNHADAQYNLDIARQAVKLENDQPPPTPEDPLLQKAGGDESGSTSFSKGASEQKKASIRRASDTQDSDSRIDLQANSDKPGDLSQTKISKNAGSADAPGNPQLQTEETGPDKRGPAELQARESQQAAEILLREISDDPEKVLRVRLYTAHRNRQLGSRP